MEWVLFEHFFPAPGEFQSSADAVGVVAVEQSDDDLGGIIILEGEVISHALLEPRQNVANSRLSARDTPSGLDVWGFSEFR